MIGRLLAIAALAVLAVGCTDSPSSVSAPSSVSTPSSGATPSSGSAPTQEQTVTEPTGEPPPEPTDPETTQRKQSKPSVRIANAPVGGSGENAGAQHCVEIRWLGEPLPEGTTVTLGGPYLGKQKNGIFVLDQSACDDFGGRPCPNVVWRPDDLEPCSIGLRQVANNGPDPDVGIPAFVACTAQKICDDLKRSSGGSDISVFPADIEISPSGTPSEEPSPDKTPSGG
ncbi:MAG TPA: hypothetical protein VFI00_02625 [Kribbella sp.]|nr:hypothetical protein [Kribbella sp.]